MSTTVKTNPTVFAARLSLRDTTEEMIDMMRTMKHVRESKWDHIICMISGYDDDPRELWQVPEVRAYTRRLFTTGFVAYLDVFASMNPDPDTCPIVRSGFGSGELWLVMGGHNIVADHFTMTEKMVADFRSDLIAAGRAAEKTVGIPGGY